MKKADYVNAVTAVLYLLVSLVAGVLALAWLFMRHITGWEFLTLYTFSWVVGLEAGQRIDKL